MMLLSCLSGILICSVAAESNYWGGETEDTDYFLCGNCAKVDGEVAKCTRGPAEAGGGKCPEAACQAGWQGERCDEPICKNVDCMGGECTGPDQCVCTALTSRLELEDGKVGCYSLRKSGLKGAVAALFVLIFSISGCAIGHHFNTKQS